MSSKKHIIKYESAIDTNPNALVPIKTLVPKWYKDLRLFYNNQVIDPETSSIIKTIKNCTPVMDSLTSGYAITLPHDIAISYDANGQILFGGLHQGDALIRVRDSRPNQTMPKPFGYNHTELIWRSPVAITVPVGCSFIFTHPFNRFDLPFITLSGIIDGGFVMNSNGNIPFYIKEGFKGIIEQGTPIAQIIPFEHSRWKSENSEGLVKIGDLHNSSNSSKIINGWYKKTWWVKKQYD
jgi:hypothetical protein